MKLALHCHGKLKLTMEENGRGGDPRKKKGELPLTQASLQMLQEGVFVLQSPKDANATLVACANLAHQMALSALDEASRRGLCEANDAQGPWRGVQV
ncbi:hypothetical protein LR48_Vigan01g044000 [Vigna angularis]|uniref:Uncharacterized protein n=1 Tax=Phaseolus angularis TaxID=3914 RepID=A0A0L9TK00_PHAAN|nr:hypothetical protein LR48_Vigan01g044000 [Vigna angularis]